MHGTLSCYLSIQSRIEKCYFRTEANVSGQIPNYPGQLSKFNDNSGFTRFSETKHEIPGFMSPDK